MHYVSTRGAAPRLNFADAMLAGLAADGGLYVPERFPRLEAEEIAALAGLDYGEAAFRVTWPYVVGSMAEDDYHHITHETYLDFTHAAVAPLKELAPDLWLLELFHGPTLAFKDYAMQLLGNLFDHVLKSRGRRATIVGATSGDTGSAAIEACRGRAAIDIFVLFPKGRVSPVQQRQMTTVDAPNVHAIAIEGTFDDCQSIVKALFNDATFRDEVQLSGVNSINWARILGQTVYYFTAAAALGAPAREVAFSVPTGNFGNIYAGWVAKQMGLPVSRLVLATNANDILSRMLATGVMKRGTVTPSYSPSMDIQVASNFERLLYALTGGDASRTAQQMAAFADTGELALGEQAWDAVKRDFVGFRLDDEGTLREIRATRDATGEILDPHTAIGVAAARATLDPISGPAVSLATAHPAKFPDAVKAAVHRRPALPRHLADLFEREERFEVLPNDPARVREAIRGALAAKGAA